MKEPTLEGLLGRFASEDWGTWLGAIDQRLDPQAAHAKQEENKVARQALAHATAKLFATPDGEKLLEHILDKTLRRVAFYTQLGLDPHQTVAWGAFREGQNALVVEIIRLIAEGRNEPPPPARET